MVGIWASLFWAIIYVNYAFFVTFLQFKSGVDEIIQLFIMWTQYVNLSDDGGLILNENDSYVWQ